jgi:hypothetical protein
MAATLLCFGALGLGPNSLPARAAFSSALTPPHPAGGAPAVNSPAPSARGQLQGSSGEPQTVNGPLGLGTSSNSLRSTADGTVIPPTGAEEWDVIPSPNGTGLSTLASITCPSANDCWAVGTVIEQWNGEYWALTGYPVSPLSSVTCVSSTDCWAVGAEPGQAQSVSEQFNGTTWSVDGSSPNGGGLSSVTCISATDCWAAGTTSIEQFNGTAWSIAAYNLGPLSSVTCVDSTDCWAVGYQQEGNGAPYLQRALFYQYDGTSWSVVTPSALVEGDLASVSCASATDCWAVGTSYSAPYEETLFVHYDGTSWTQYTATSADGNGVGLAGVTCLSATDCWSVGSIGSTALDQWNGSAWSLYSNPDTGALVDLTGVTCVNAAVCWAVGIDAGTIIAELQQPAGPWTVASSPSSDVLYADTCTSPDECWAVGTGASGPETAIEENIGGGWGTVSSPS